METHLFILLFYTGIVPFVLPVPRKYYLIQQGKTWTEAHTYCRTNHADLAIIQSNDDMVRLQREIQMQKFNSSAWIGLNKEIISWYWSMGNGPVGSIEPSAPTEPNNIGGHQWCGLIKSDGWGDGGCTAKYPFVCFDGTKTGDQQYIYISNTVSWYEAQAYCRNHHTDLASARNATENSIIRGLTTGWAWFGMTRELWKWTDQSNFSTVNWMSGKPASSQRYCGFINNGQAGDALCSDSMPFFCYSEITGQQQIMRLEVRSDKDVNDPAIINAMMENIEQKLKECGLLENVTVKCRMESDRGVFQKKKEKKIATSSCESQE